MRTILPVLTLALLVTPALADDGGFRLENGLDVVLRPVAGATDVAVVVLLSVGGDHDPTGKSGLGHLVEHLHVTAAAGEGRPVRTADDFMRRYPKGWNAQTGDAYTVFATVTAGEGLDAEIADAAARMGSLAITQADLDRERPRMMLELDMMYGGAPALAAMNLARDIARPSLGGGRRAGVPEEIAALTVEDAEGHWKRLYKPANALLVVAGALDPATARAAVEKHFGTVPAGERAEVPDKKPSNPESRTTEVKVEPAPEGATSRVCLAYPAPAPGSDAYAPFLVLAARLFSASMGSSKGPSPFPPVQFMPLDDPAALYVSDALGADETAEAATKRLQARVDEVVGKPLDPKELRAARAAWGRFLATDEVSDHEWKRMPYLLAFGIGRRRQLGLDGAALRTAIDAVTEETLRAKGADAFAAARRATAVVRVGGG